MPDLCNSITLQDRKHPDTLKPCGSCRTLAAPEVQCCPFLTSQISGLGVVGRDKYGVFPLRGKLLNVRDASTKQITDNAEISLIKQIMGLQHGKVYEDTKALRYGHLMIMTDQVRCQENIQTFALRTAPPVPIGNLDPGLRTPVVLEERFVDPLQKSPLCTDDVSFSTSVYFLTCTRPFSTRLYTRGVSSMGDCNVRPHIVCRITTAPISRASSSISCTRSGRRCSRYPASFSSLSHQSSRWD